MKVGNSFRSRKVREDQVSGPLWSGSEQGKGEPQKRGQSGIGSKEKSPRGSPVKGPKYQ